MEFVNYNSKNSDIYFTKEEYIERPSLWPLL